MVQAGVKREQSRVGGLRLSTTAWFIGLFALGLALRLPGLLVNGQLDLDEILFVWGAEVHYYGLAQAFKVNYGLFSYALYGLAFAIAETMPRFWWAPYKFIEIAFEAGIFLALYRLMPRRWVWAAFPMFWLNPWFSLHGAWQGFWEGPHVLLGLLAVLVMGRYATPSAKAAGLVEPSPDGLSHSPVGASPTQRGGFIPSRPWTDERIGWLLVGVLLMSSAMFKPQGLAYFVIPVGLYLTIQLVRYRHPAVLWYSLGLALVVVLGTVWVVLIGGRVTAILDNYLSAVTVMPNICNGCVSGWRTVAYALQLRLSQGGPTYMLRLPPWLNNTLNGLATVGTLALLVVMAWRLPLIPARPLALRPLVWLRSQVARWISTTTEVVTAPSEARTLLVVLALGSLIVSQIGTRAHINHTYTALVMLIPLVIGQTRLLIAWGIMVGVQFYAHLATYYLGRTAMFPQIPHDPLPAQTLVDGIHAALATQPYAGLLHYQTRLNDMLAGTLPQEPIIAGLSLVHFLCAAYVIYALLRERKLDIIA